MTPAQINLLHIAIKQCGINDGQYRVILRNVAKRDRLISSKQLSNEEFEDVMALLERDYGFRHRGKPEDYWRNRVLLRGSFGGERMVHLITNLAARTRYARGLDGLCRKFSNGRTGEVSKLTPPEAHNLAEMLKSVIERLEAAGEQIAAEPPAPTLFPMAPAAPRLSMDPTAKPIHAGASPARAQAPGDQHEKGADSITPDKSRVPRVSSVQEFEFEEEPF